MSIMCHDDDMKPFESKIKSTKIRNEFLHTCTRQYCILHNTNIVNTINIYTIILTYSLYTLMILTIACLKHSSYRGRSQLLDTIDFLL